jgi:hypothetical protein
MRENNDRLELHKLVGSDSVLLFFSRLRILYYSKYF